MNIESLVNIAKFFDDRKSVAIVRKGLSIFFCGVIASLLFESIYYDYYLLDITDYKGIYFFFARGKFLIPVVLFFGILVTTKYGFILYNEYRLRRIQEKYGLKEKEEVEQGVSKWINKKESVKNATERLYGRFTSGGLTVEGIGVLLSKSQRNLEEYLILLLRTLITFVLVFLTQNVIDSISFTVITVLIVILFIILMMFNGFLEVIPLYIKAIIKGIETAMQTAVSEAASNNDQT